MFKILRTRPPINTPKRIYKDVSLGHLINSYMILAFSRYDVVIDNFDGLINLTKKMLGANSMFWILGNTVGRQFTGGNTIQDVEGVCGELSQRKFHIAVNYLAEYLPEFNNDEFFDATCKRYVDTFKLSDKIADQQFFNAIKLSGMIDFNLLKKMNMAQERMESIFWESKDVKIEPRGYYISRHIIKEEIKKVTGLSDDDIDNYLSLIKMKHEDDVIYLTEWRLQSNCFNLNNEEIRNNIVYKSLSGYTESELLNISKFINRILLIVNEAKSFRSNILVDAEQSYLQKAIYNIVEQLMYHYNSPDHYFIFNTVQNYTIESVNLINEELHKLEFFGSEYPLMMKMVRGAYLEEENRISELKGYPICWSAKELTDKAYNENSLKLLDAKAKYKKILIATHNNESLNLIGDALVEKEKQLGLNQDEKSKLHNEVYFATLLGLNDFLAYESLEKGYSTIKYIPYGENHITLPYLIRRGRECRNLIRKSDKEIRSIRDEIMARLSFK